MQNIFTNIKCNEIILNNANENWYIILYDLFSRLCYIATCGPFCKDATHMLLYITNTTTEIKVSFHKLRDVNKTIRTFYNLGCSKVMPMRQTISFIHEIYFDDYLTLFHIRWGLKRSRVLKMENNFPV